MVGASTLACPRARFATAGLCVAIALVLLAPLLARVVPVGHAGSTFAVASLLLVSLGYGVGGRVEVLERSSYEDPVTHVGNRRHWEKRLSAEVERALASRMPLAMLVLDVDNLKKLNDAHGHGCGDRALRIVGAVLLETCRSRDVAARFGGDEFVLLLPRTRVSEARVVAERVRVEIARRRGELGTGGAPLRGPPLSVSIGIADLASIDHASGRALFEAADRALYAAKSAGRDRIEEFERAPTSSGVIQLDRARTARRNKKARADA